MSAHTPGPWMVRRFRTAGPVHVMSECGRYVMDGSSQHSSRIRNEADAKLIAAAPELLEALHRLQWLHHDDVFVYGDDDEQRVNEALANARAAIAKAIGAA